MLKQQHFRNIGKASDFTNTTLLADFQYSLGSRYQFIMGALSAYINQDTKSASSVASQQYYYYPVGTIGVDSATITVGSEIYTLTPIYSQHSWNLLNSTTVTGLPPQFIFARRDDFGIWPIPSAVYTLNFNRYARDRNLLVDDYTTGTVAVTNGSSVVTGTDTTFTPAMVGRWFEVTDTAAHGQGYWYRVATYTSATVLGLETYWNGSTGSALAYLVGETPEMPEEGHNILTAGTAADYYAGLRNDAKTATWWNNIFMTGDGANNLRDENNKNIMGGLIGMIRKYKDRDRDNVIIRRPGMASPSTRIFGATIT